MTDVAPFDSAMRMAAVSASRANPRPRALHEPEPQLGHAVARRAEEPDAADEQPVGEPTDRVHPERRVARMLDEPAQHVELVDEGVVGRPAVVRRRRSAQDAPRLVDADRVQLDARDTGHGGDHQRPHAKPSGSTACHATVTSPRRQRDLLPSTGQPSARRAATVAMNLWLGA